MIQMKREVYQNTQQHTNSTNHIGQRKKDNFLFEIIFQQNGGDIHNTHGRRKPIISLLKTTIHQIPIEENIFNWNDEK